MSSLAFQDLGKTFPGHVEAVRALSVEVPHGALAVIIGASGSGKSTVLRLIAGLEAPTAGHVLIDGAVVNRVPPHKRGVAMVFQQPALFPYLSVRQNLARGLARLGLDRAAVAERVAEAARLLAIEPLLDRWPHQLSGGEAQRVALGRAIARRPGLLLLDEPLASLDAALRSRLRAELRTLHRQLGGTTVHVTHDQAEALSLADLLLVLDRGRLRQAGPPMDVYDQPADRFVAELLGDPGMNLWRGAVQAGRFATPDGAIQAPADGAEPGPAVLGVRPERLRLDGRGDFLLAAGRVTRLEPLGRDTLVRVGAGAQTVTAIARRPCAWAPGLEVSLHADRADLHLFAADESGRRLG